MSDSHAPLAVPGITMIPGASNADIALWLADRLNARIATAPAKTRIAITVPGGNTPFPIFDELAKLPVDFARLSIWPGDDRIVPEDHPPPTSAACARPSPPPAPRSPP